MLSSSIEHEVSRQQAELHQYVTSGQHQQGIYGLQWGDPRRHPHLQEVVERAIDPYLASGDLTVLEIGAGGGRWSRELVGRSARLILVDGEPMFEQAIRRHSDCRNVEFVVSPDGALPTIADASVDFAFSFDTFVHFHNDLFARYVASIGRILKPGGYLTLHFAREYPELADHNSTHFNYQQDEDVADLLAHHQLRLTGRQIDFKMGWGSKLVVAKKDW